MGIRFCRFDALAIVLMSHFIISLTNKKAGILPYACQLVALVQLLFNSRAAGDFRSAGQLRKAQRGSVHLCASGCHAKYTRVRVAVALPVPCAQADDKRRDRNSSR